MPYTWITSTEQSCWQKMDTGEASDGARANLTIGEDRYQEWQGFGGCFNELGAQALDMLDRRDRDRVISDLFDPNDGCRFNYCRVSIGANDYAASWYSHNENSGDYEMQHFSIDRDRQSLLPYIKDARQYRPDITLFASPWSPPTWMKYPCAYNYGNLIQTPENLQAYALYFKKFVEAYQAEGVPLKAIHVQNEPNSNQKFPSCVWKPEEMRDFIKNYLGPLFEKENVNCEIWAGTIERDGYDDWVNTMLADPDAAAYIAGLGFQWAGKGCLQRTRLSWPEFPMIQTENECGDGQNDWAYAMYVFRLLWHYITNGVVAYLYWNMVLPPGGESTWGWEQNAMITVDPLEGTVTKNPEFYVMKHFSAFVKPGAKVCGLRGPWTGDAVAFENPDSSIAVMCYNPFAEKSPLVLDVRGEKMEMEMPGHSFNTVYVNA